MEAEGPDPLAPAQATQLDHPLIFWIWLFTVCADEETEAAAKRNSAMARMDKFLILVVTITNFYSRGVFLFSIAINLATVLEITDASTLEQPFFIVRQ